MPEDETDRSGGRDGDETFELIAESELHALQRRRSRFLAAAMAAVLAPALWWTKAIGLAGLAGLVALGWIVSEVRAFRHRDDDEPAGRISLGAESVALSLPNDRKDVRTFPYERLLAVYRRDWFGSPTLHVSVPTGGTLITRSTLDVPERLLVDATVQNVVDALRTRLHARSCVEALARSEHHGSFIDRMRRGTALVSLVAASTLTLAFVLQSAWLGTELLENADLYQLVEWGVLASVFVEDGQWFRLVTSHLIHDDFTHFAGNLVSILTVGWALEKSVGGSRWLVVGLLGGLTSGIATLYFTPTAFQYGSSGVAFALFGGLGAVWLRFRRETPPDLTPLLGLSLFFVVVSVGIGLAFDMPESDAHHAHAAGLLTGLLTGLVVSPKHADLSDRNWTPAWVDATAILLLSVYAGAVALGVDYQRNRPHYGDQRAFVEFTARSLPEQRRPFLYNDFAWSLALKPELPDAALMDVREMSATTVEAEPDNPAFNDTLATLTARLAIRSVADSDATLERAVELGRRALRQALRKDTEYATTRFYATQLARFAERCGEPCRDDSTDEPSSSPLEVLVVERDGDGPKSVAWRCFRPEGAPSLDSTAKLAPDSMKRPELLATATVEDCSAHPDNWLSWRWSTGLPPLE